MPVFDFSCGCGAKMTDVVLRINDDKEKWPLCHVCGEKMTKDWAKVNAIFKGRGFHANDYHAPTRGH